MRTITLEEHFVTTDFLNATKSSLSSPAMAAIREQLLDLGAGRIAAMDEGGVDLQVLSVAAVGLEQIPAEDATKILADANDQLALAIKENPSRLAGFASLSLKSPESGRGLYLMRVFRTTRYLLIALTMLLCKTPAFAAGVRTPTQDGIVYGVADGQQLTMDYYAPKGPGPHPIAIIVHGGGYHGGTSKSGSEAYCADFLAPAGYAVFSVNYRLAPKYPYPYMVYDVERAIRFIRHNAKQWDGEPNRIALVGGSAGGFLSNMVGLLQAPGDPKSADPVDRESAKVQAVVTLFAQSSFATVPLNADVHAFLDPLIKEKGETEALKEASPITYVSKNAPPFLQILGDKDEYIPFSEVTNLDAALHHVGVQSEIIRIPGGMHGTGGWYKLPGVPDWERQMTAWLNRSLGHSGPIGEGIRKREPVTAATTISGHVN